MNYMRDYQNKKILRFIGVDIFLPICQNKIYNLEHNYFVYYLTYR